MGSNFWFGNCIKSSEAYLDEYKNEAAWEKNEEDNGHENEADYREVNGLGRAIAKAIRWRDHGVNTKVVIGAFHRIRLVLVADKFGALGRPAHRLRVQIHTVVVGVGSDLQVLVVVVVRGRKYVGEHKVNDNVQRLLVPNRTDRVFQQTFGSAQQRFTMLNIDHKNIRDSNELILMVLDHLWAPCLPSRRRNHQATRQIACQAVQGNKRDLFALAVIRSDELEVGQTHFVLRVRLSDNAVHGKLEVGQVNVHAECGMVLTELNQDAEVFVECNEELCEVIVCGMVGGLVLKGWVLIAAELLQFGLVLLVQNAVQCGEEVAQKVFVLDVEERGRIVDLILDNERAQILDRGQIKRVQTVFTGCQETGAKSGIVQRWVIAIEKKFN